MLQALLAKIGVSILILSGVFAIGYSQAWKQSQTEISALKATIQVANAQYAKALADATAKVTESTQKQIITAEKLQAQHNESTQVNNSLRSELADARLQYRTANKTRSGCTVPNPGDTREDSGTDEAGFYLDPAQLSEEFDRLIQEKAPAADQIDADKHFLLQWLNSLPPELIHD